MSNGERPSEAAIRRRLIERQSRHAEAQRRRGRTSRLMARLGGAPEGRRGFGMAPIGRRSALARLRRRPITAFFLAAFVAGGVGAAVLGWQGDLLPAPGQADRHIVADTGSDEAGSGASPGASATVTVPAARVAQDDETPSAPRRSPGGAASAGDPAATTAADAVEARSGAAGSRGGQAREAAEDEDAVSAALALRLPETRGPADLRRRDLEEAISGAVERDATITGSVDGAGPDDEARMQALRDLAASMEGNEARATADRGAPAPPDRPQDRPEGAAPPEAPPARTTADVNMRASPENDARILTVVAADTPVTVIECDGWCEIERDGSTGYIYEDFIDRPDS